MQGLTCAKTRSKWLSWTTSETLWKVKGKAGWFEQFLNTSCRICWNLLSELDFLLVCFCGVCSPAPFWSFCIYFNPFWSFNLSCVLFLQPFGTETCHLHCIYWSICTMFAAFWIKMICNDMIRYVHTLFFCSFLLWGWKKMLVSFAASFFVCKLSRSFYGG